MAQVQITLTDIGNLDEGFVEIEGIQLGESADGHFTASQMVAMFLPSAIKQGWFRDKMMDFIDDLLDAQQSSGGGFSNDGGVPLIAA